MYLKELISQGWQSLMRDRMRSSPLCDGPRFVANLERLYRAQILLINVVSERSGPSAATVRLDRHVPPDSHRNDPRGCRAG